MAACTKEEAFPVSSADRVPERVLALDGGLPVRSERPPPWPFYDADETAAVTHVLSSGRVNAWTGNDVANFEAEAAQYIGRTRSIALSNGSVALELALRALAIGPGDEVIVPARSFVATASSVSLTGATPVFADVDFHAQVVSVATIEPLVGARTRAIVPVHLNGWPCDMPAIMEFAKRRNLRVIEDCAQSFGATIGGVKLGTFGDAAAFSFCQDKIVSTGGEGGMVMFADERAADIAWSFKDHGKSFDKMFRTGHPPGYRWIHDGIGTNWRMTGLQAAIGRVQLGKLDRWLAARRSNAARLASVFGRFACMRIPAVPPEYGHARYRLETTIDETLLRPGWSRDKVMMALNAEGIAANVGCCPEIYREAAFNREKTYPRLPNAERLGRESLVFLTHPTIDESYLSDCETAIQKVIGAACR